MNVDIYKSLDTSGRYFVVPSGSDVTNLPEKVNSTPEKSININTGENRIGLSGDDAISDITSKGYHATDVSIKFTENT